MKTSIHSLVILLHRQAVSFCHYETGVDESEPSWMPLATLEGALELARQNKWAPTCVLGNAHLPPAHAAALERVPHAKIVPFQLWFEYPDATPVVHMEAVSRVTRREWQADEVILRVPRHDLEQLASDFVKLSKHAHRVNVRLLELEDYDESDFDTHWDQCTQMAKAIAAMAWPKEGAECNLLTDRLVLSEMHNCGAGIEHITIAPDGKLYLCPGFYTQPDPEPVGSLENGLEIRNANLLSREGAPICRTCDAYHCLRCVWLNRRTTMEINTPSRQQCVVSHLERKASEELRRKLGTKAGKDLGQLSPIPALDYLDPFEKVRKKTVKAQPVGRVAKGARWLDKPEETQWLPTK